MASGLESVADNASRLLQLLRSNILRLNFDSSSEELPLGDAIRLNELKSLKSQVDSQTRSRVSALLSMQRSKSFEYAQSISTLKDQVQTVAGTVMDSRFGLSDQLEECDNAYRHFMNEHKLALTSNEVFDTLAAATRILLEGYEHLLGVRLVEAVKSYVELGGKCHMLKMWPVLLKEPAIGALFALKNRFVEELRRILKTSVEDVIHVDLIPSTNSPERIITEPALFSAKDFLLEPIWFTNFRLQKESLANYRTQYARSSDRSWSPESYLRSLSSIRITIRRVGSTSLFEAFETISALHEKEQNIGNCDQALEFSLGMLASRLNAQLFAPLLAAASFGDQFQLPQLITIAGHPSDSEFVSDFIFELTMKRDSMTKKGAGIDMFAFVSCLCRAILLALPFRSAAEHCWVLRKVPDLSCPFVSLADIENLGPAAAPWNAFSADLASTWETIVRCFLIPRLVPTSLQALLDFRQRVAPALTAFDCLLASSLSATKKNEHAANRKLIREYAAASSELFLARFEAQVAEESRNFIIGDTFDSVNLVVFKSRLFGSLPQDCANFVESFLNSEQVSITEGAINVIALISRTIEVNFEEDAMLKFNEKERELFFLSLRRVLYLLYTSYVAIGPAYFDNDLLRVPHISALFANNCSLLAAHAISMHAVLARQFRRLVRLSTQCDYELGLACKPLEDTSARYFMHHLSNARAEVIEVMDSFGGFAGIEAGPRYESASRAISGSLSLRNRLLRSWTGVVSRETVHKIGDKFISLIGAQIVSFTLDRADISVEAAARIHDLAMLVLQQPYPASTIAGAPPGLQNTEDPSIRIFGKNDAGYLRLKALTIAIAPEQSLLGIQRDLQNGRLTGLSRSELIHLVRALYEDSLRRHSCIAFLRDSTNANSV